MENNITWLLIADASKARLYSIHKALVFKDPTNTKHLNLLNQYTHEKSRKKTAELITDKMGEFGSGTFVENTAPKLHEAELFALQLVEQLEAGRKKNSFRDIVLVAPPNFMGLLHKHMHREIAKHVSKTIEKDYTNLNDKQLLQTLINQL